LASGEPLQAHVERPVGDLATWWKGGRTALLAQLGGEVWFVLVLR